MSIAENKIIAEKFIDEIFNKVNLENIDRFLTPDFIYHGSGEDISGMENFKEWVSSDHNIIPDIHFTIEESISELNRVATVWVVEGTHSKDFRGIPATHKKFDTAGISIPWEELIKKEARGINDDDLGEVQQIEQDIIVTRAGVVDKITYRLPKSLADRYDGHNVWFKITKDEAKAQYGID